MLLVAITGKDYQERTTPMKEVIIMAYTTSTEINSKDNKPLRMPTYVSNMPAYLVEETHTTIARWAVEESWKLGLHPLQIAAHELFSRQHETWLPYMLKSDDGPVYLPPWHTYPCCGTVTVNGPADMDSLLQHITSVQHVAMQYHVKSSQLFDVYVLLCEERGVTPY